MFHRFGYVVLVVLSAGVLASCDSSTTSTATPSIVQPGTTPAALPFTFQFGGEGSSPSFNIVTAGSYSVRYMLTGGPPPPSAAPLACNIYLVAANGSQLAVVPTVVLQQNATKQASAVLALTPGAWRFQTGGTCSGNLAVNPAG